MLYHQIQVLTLTMEAGWSDILVSDNDTVATRALIGEGYYIASV